MNNSHLKPRAVRVACVSTTGLLLSLSTANGCLLVSPLDDITESSSSTGGRSTMDGGGEDAPSTGGQPGDDGGGVGGEGSAGDASSTCNENADCESIIGAPSRCLPGGECVQLTSPECPIVVGDWRNPDSIFFGAFGALEGRDPQASEVLWNPSLALSELSGDGVIGLPGTGGRRRPLVMTMCNNYASLATGNPDDVALAIDRGMAHLIDDIGVPAVLAALLPNDLLRTFDAYGRARSVFFLSPFPANETLAAEDDGGLLWHMLGKPSDMAPTYAALVSRLEARARAHHGMADADPVRVAAVTSYLAIDQELSASAGPLLHFNGKDALSNTNDGNLKIYTLTEGRFADDVTDTKTDLIHSFQPHIVVSFTGRVFTQDIFHGIETTWTPTATLPYYVFSPTNVPSLSLDVQPLIDEQLGVNQDTGAARRFTGVNVAGSEDRVLYNAYQFRLVSLFPEASGVPEQTENFYDATYFLAYAMAAAGNVGTLTGADIERGIRRLVSGATAFDIGPDDRDEMLTLLTTTSTFVRLNGTLGPPNFETAAGHRIDTGSVFCFSRTVTDTLQSHFQVYQFDTAAGALRASKLYPESDLPCQKDLLP